MNRTDGSDVPGGHLDAAADPRARAIAAEQAHLERASARLTVLRSRAAAEAAAIQGDRLGPTFQARFERDAFAHHHAARAARLTLGDDEALVFGRLDTREGASLPVGRLHVADEDGRLLVMDWRAPAAAPFYRATAADPQGVARRRVIVTRLGRVLDVEDELIDVAAADALRLESVTGQGALLAALERARGPHLQAVVATIQADQDRIIRAPAVGTLVVTGGPGTGKTVVALHRVAYLLYEQRARLGPRGVLVVGPSRAFTAHTARVLPALGEDRVVQRPLEALGPRGLDVRGWDEPDLAALKGDLAMVALVRRLHAAALPRVPEGTRVGVRGTQVVLGAGEVTALRERLLARLAVDDPRRTYHARTAAAEAALRELAWRRWTAAIEAAGGTAPATRDEVDFDEAADDSPTLRMLWRCYWPPLSAEDVLGRVRSGAIDPVAVGRGLLPDAALARLAESWRTSAGWTVEDVAILDELDALLGPIPRAAAAEEDVVPGGGAGPPLGGAVDAVAAPADLADPWYREFGHVVVDEAQDLSPLQWRAVARRGAYATWTVVGDLAQRARVREPSTWEAVAALIGRSQVAVERLTVNYRSPRELEPVARAVLAATGHRPEDHPTAVRDSGRPPRLVVSAEPLSAVGDEVAGLLARGGGSIAVVVAAGSEDAAARALVPVVASSGGTRVAVHAARGVKGLEFDDVVVVDPAAIARASAVGLHDLYVAVTRATRSLVVVARRPEDLPGHESLETGRSAVEDV